MIINDFIFNDMRKLIASVLMLVAIVAVAETPRYPHRLTLT